MSYMTGTASLMDGPCTVHMGYSYTISEKCIHLIFLTLNILINNALFSHPHIQAAALHSTK